MVKRRKFADSIKSIVRKRQSLPASPQDSGARDIAGSTTLLKKRSDGFDTTNKDTRQGVPEVAKAEARGGPHVENTLNIEQPEGGVDKVPGESIGGAFVGVHRFVIRRGVRVIPALNCNIATNGGMRCVGHGYFIQLQKEKRDALSWNPLAAGTLRSAGNVNGVLQKRVLEERLRFLVDFLGIHA